MIRFFRKLVSIALNDFTWRGTFIGVVLLLLFIFLAVITVILAVEFPIFGFILFTSIILGTIITTVIAVRTSEVNVD